MRFARGEYGFTTTVNGTTVTVTRTGRNWLAVVGYGQASAFGSTREAAVRAALRNA
jgi:hypothetical protein